MPETFQERMEFIAKLVTSPYSIFDLPTTTVVEFDVCPSCGCAHYMDVPCSKFSRPEGL